MRKDRKYEGSGPRSFIRWCAFSFGAAVALLFCAAPALPQATLLPNAIQQFFSQSGAPLNGGSVYFYIPSTTTPKTVWQDNGQTTPYSNPITLNAAGEPTTSAGIYGAGAYRQQVFDINNNLVWDALTNGVAPSPGTNGDGMPLGFIMPYAGSALPTGYDFAAGQAYNRTTYSALLAVLTLTQNATCTNSSGTITGLTDTHQMGIGQTVESLALPPGTTITGIVSTTSITVSQTVTAASGGCTLQVFPYGNGNSASTFNLPNLNGYVLAGADNMNSTVANILTSTTRANGWDFLGAAGGTQSYVLLQANLPAIKPAITITDPGHTHTFTAVAGNGPYNISLGSGDPLSNSLNTTNSSTTGITAAFTSNLGSATAMSLVQPTLTVNYIIKVSANVGAFSIPIANNTVLGNNSGVSTPPSAITASAVLDMECATVGSLQERGTLGWGCLTPGTSGYFLMSQGVGATPVYAPVGVSPGALTLPANQIYVGTAGNVAGAVALGGDCGIVSAGTITCTKTSGNPFNQGVLVTGAYGGAFTDGLICDYSSSTARCSAGAGDGFAWYNNGVANTSLMALSSGGVLSGATWQGATVGLGYGGTGITTGTTGGIPYFTGSSTAMSSSGALALGAVMLGGGAGAPYTASGCTIDTNNSLVCTSANASRPFFEFFNTTADAGASAMVFAKSRTSSTITTGDVLGTIQFYGYFNSSYQPSAQIVASSTGTLTGSNVPSFIKMYTSNAAGQENQTLTFDNNSHLGNAQAAAPTAATCTGFSLATGATDFAGKLTMTSGTTCSVNFATAFTNAPACVISPGSAASTHFVTSSTSGFAVTFGSAQTGFSWHCIGN